MTFARKRSKARQERGDIDESKYQDHSQGNGKANGTVRIVDIGLPLVSIIFKARNVALKIITESTTSPQP